MTEAAVRLARDQTCVMHYPSVLSAYQIGHWDAPEQTALKRQYMPAHT